MKQLLNHVEFNAKVKQRCKKKVIFLCLRSSTFDESLENHSSSGHYHGSQQSQAQGAKSSTKLLLIPENSAIPDKPFSILRKLLNTVKCLIGAPFRIYRSFNMYQEIILRAVVMLSEKLL